jgi:hypothetical protein
LRPLNRNVRVGAIAGPIDGPGLNWGHSMKAILIIGSAALLLSACGSKPDSDSGETAAATSAVATAAASSMGMEVSTADLPAFVALPEDAKAVQRMNSSNDGQVGGMIVIETAKPAAEVLGFYRDAMAKNGMKVGMETTTGDGAMIMGATEGETKVLSVIVSPGDAGKTSVAITHAEKQG